MMSVLLLLCLGLLGPALTLFELVKLTVAAEGIFEWAGGQTNL